MASASSLKLQPGEHRIAVIRGHWWLVVRPLVWIVPLLACLPVYALADYCLPAAGLARFSDGIDIAVLSAIGLLLLKWLLRDVARWSSTWCVLTNLRIVEQRGVATVRRREAYLRSARPRDVTQRGAAAKLLNYGDLVVEIEGRGSLFVLKQVPRPHVLEAALQSLALEAQDDHRRLRGNGDGQIQAALTRIFHGGSGEDNTPTIELERITPLTVYAQRRLMLGGDEAVLFATRRHVALLARGLFLALAADVGVCVVLWAWRPAIPSGAIVVLALFAALWPFLLVFDWRTRLYVLTSERLVRLHNPLSFMRRYDGVELRAVRDVVACSTPIGGRLLNMGSILLERGDDGAFICEAVPDPDHLKRLVHDGIESAFERDRLAEHENLAGRLTDWFEEYHRMQASP
jgi:hypothetical protein